MNRKQRIILLSSMRRTLPRGVERCVNPIMGVLFQLSSARSGFTPMFRGGSRQQARRRRQSKCPNEGCLMVRVGEEKLQWRPDSTGVTAYFRQVGIRSRPYVCGQPSAGNHADPVCSKEIVEIRWRFQRQSNAREASSQD